MCLQAVFYDQKNGVLQISFLTLTMILILILSSLTAIPKDVAGTITRITEGLER